MKSYWVWLFLNGIVWLLAFIYDKQTVGDMTIQLFGVSLYFIHFFLIPLFIRKKKFLAFILSVNMILACFILFPYTDKAYNPYLLLIVSLIIAEGFYRLEMIYSTILGFIGAVGLMITIHLSHLELLNEFFIEVYIVLFLLAMIFYKKTKNRFDDLDARNQALLSEFRHIKRRATSEEEIARQEERVLIAHEIHDSVGHKLTALLVQLEMFRLHISDPYKEQVQLLKDLANASLEETRRAVKSLKASETGGLSGILRLIRKLEMESLIRIHFSVKHGAFAAPLSGEQSFVIYRSVQEALTNVMKHSQAKEAEIMFDAPGGSIFRFEIINPIKDSSGFMEGFGLTSMRERLIKFGGNLEVTKTADQFVVKGYIKMRYEGLE